MSWVRIMAPLSGAAVDLAELECAAALARPFAAELAAVYAPADAADLMPWMGEGYMGGVQIAALDSLREAVKAAEAHAVGHVAACDYPRIRVVSLASPVAAGLAMEARLSDVVVFTQDAARGRGPLAEAFHQILLDERRPVVVARGKAPTLQDTVVVAWDGGREATRSARVAMPWLQKAARVLILAAPEATPRSFDPARLRELFAERGVSAEVRRLEGAGEPGPLLLSAAAEAGAALIVAGAFGHSRFQQVVFGGATRCLLADAGAPALFLAH